jgi:hypothetical protein
MYAMNRDESRMELELVMRARKEAAILWISVMSGPFQSCQEDGWLAGICP